jgi:hypothetical protein
MMDEYHYIRARDQAQPSQSRNDSDLEKAPVTTTASLISHPAAIPKKRGLFDRATGKGFLKTLGLKRDQMPVPVVAQEITEETEMPIPLADVQLTESPNFSLALKAIDNDNLLGKGNGLRSVLSDAATDINEQDANGDSLLILAVQRDAGKNMIEELLKKGANVNLANKGGDTAFIRAAARNRQDIVDLLLKNGANKDHTNNKGENAAMKASLIGQDYKNGTNGRTINAKTADEYAELSDYISKLEQTGGKRKTRKSRKNKKTKKARKGRKGRKSRKSKK